MPASSNDITPLLATSGEAFVARIPGSKSYTNRALIVAAQRPGTTEVTGALHSDDTLHLARCLDAFDGLSVAPTDGGGGGFRVERRPGRLGAPSRELFVNGAGTPARFLLAFAAAVDGETVVTGNARLSERPMGDLLDALRRIGIRCECLAREGCLPVRVHGGRPATTDWEVHGGVSSQFVSALALAAAQNDEGPVTVRVTGHLVSRPYVEMTLRMLADSGVSCAFRGDHELLVLPEVPAAEVIPVEADASAMSYFLVAAAITGTRVRIPGIGGGSAQGDLGLAFALERMGCRLAVGATSIELEGGPLHGIDIDMETMPDTVLSLAVAAALASSETRIHNIANLRVKECDRIHAAAAELARLGVPVEEGPDFLVVRPSGRLRPAHVHTYDDHRVAMSFGLLRLLFEGIEIEDPACVAKSFPGFWAELARFKQHHEQEVAAHVHAASLAG